MLPLNLNARGLVYNENNLKQCGIDMDEITDMEDLCAAAKKLYEEGKEGKYGLLYPVENLLKEYIWKEQGEESFSFDTEEFAALLDFMTGEYGVSAPFRNSYVAMYAWEYPEDDYSKELYDLYARGNIMFGLPEGLFDSYYRYCEGTELNREAVVAELDRKVNMYFGE